MNISKLKLLVAIVAMPIVLCSCPGHNCEEENVPKGYVVRMKNDYSGNVMVTMNLSTKGDTSYCCISKNDHTKEITEYYFNIRSAVYEDIAYLSISSSEWDDKFGDSLSLYVIDTDPFDEVYAYYNNYGIDELKEIVKKGEWYNLKKLK